MMVIVWSWNKDHRSVQCSRIGYVVRKKKHIKSQAWWYMPAISALGRWSKKDPEFKVISLDYVRLPSQKEHTENYKWCPICYCIRSSPEKREDQAPVKEARYDPDWMTCPHVDLPDQPAVPLIWSQPINLKLSPCDPQDQSVACSGPRAQRVWWSGPCHGFPLLQGLRSLHDLDGYFLYLCSDPGILKYYLL